MRGWMAAALAGLALAGCHDGAGNTGADAGPAAENAVFEKAPIDYVQPRNEIGTLRPAEKTGPEATSEPLPTNEAD